MPQKEIISDFPFPAQGIDVSWALSKQRKGTTPAGQNVRTYEPSSGRGRGGSRPGLQKYISEQLPSGPGLIQNLNIVDPTETGALLDWQLAWPLSPPVSPPDGYFLDPSDPGPQEWWGTVPVSLGIPSRIPGRIIRTGGSGIQPNKNIVSGAKVPLIVWSDPASVLPGTTLSSTQLNAVAKDPDTLAVLAGVYVYNPPLGTELSEGNDQPLTVTFYPTFTDLYTINTKTVHIDVAEPATVGYAILLPMNAASGDDAGSVFLNGVSILAFACSGFDTSLNVGVTDAAITGTTGGETGYAEFVFSSSLLIAGTNTLTLTNSVGFPSGPVTVRRFTFSGGLWQSPPGFTLTLGGSGGGTLDSSNPVTFDPNEGL